MGGAESSWALGTVTAHPVGYTRVFGKRPWPPRNAEHSVRQSTARQFGMPRGRAWRRARLASSCMRGCTPIRWCLRPHATSDCHACSSQRRRDGTPKCMMPATRWPPTAYLSLLAGLPPVGHPLERLSLSRDIVVAGGCTALHSVASDAPAGHCRSGYQTTYTSCLMSEECVWCSHDAKHSTQLEPAFVAYLGGMLEKLGRAVRRAPDPPSRRKSPCAGGRPGRAQRGRTPWSRPVCARARQPSDEVQRGCMRSNAPCPRSNPRPGSMHPPTDSPVPRTVPVRGRISRANLDMWAAWRRLARVPPMPCRISAQPD